jgi:hypothetical protein
MSSTSLVPAVAMIVSALCACSSTGNQPLLFGQTHTLGVSIGSTGGAGADLTLGFRDMDIAVVPVTITDEAGIVHQIQSNATNTEQGSGTNALSVLGQFEASTRTTDPQVGLGKFFATGLAADKLADGFSDRLGNRQPTR